MKTSAGWAMLSPHRVIMAMIFVGALMVGVAILPGANERVAMLERDGHSRDALKILETEYAHGDRKYRTLYQMQALYENEGDLPKARQLLEAMAVANPRGEIADTPEKWGSPRPDDCRATRKRLGD